MKRREFLKLAGLTAIAGVGAPTAFSKLLEGEAVASSGGGHGAAPAAAPTGKRLGMVIDVRKFNQYKGLAQQCVAACHETHNVPDFGNKKDEIKWLWEEKYMNTFPDMSHYKRDEELEAMNFLVACNHCDNPPCVRACPTQATFRMADSGIVAMDYHRCIGCRFCMAACPYGARSFNWREARGKDENGRPFLAKINPDFPTRMRGVVEKCNFCVERVSHGLMPKCVEVATPVKAMIFGDMNDPHSEISTVLRSRFTIQRKPSLGTNPSLFYLI
ncbi:MAG: sulfate reduction electron transfer complex DsrMKJOP subunit DsrO [Thermodesulfobacteriota bacterium]